MSRKNILIIEDDAELCEELREILQDEGYSVETAYTGPEAREKISEDNFSLILLDLKIPEADGMDMMKHLKQDRPERKIVIMSGNPDIAEAAGMEGGSITGKIGASADAALLKPFSIENLISLIKRLIPD